MFVFQSKSAFYVYIFIQKTSKKSKFFTYVPVYTARLLFTSRAACASRHTQVNLDRNSISSFQLQYRSTTQTAWALLFCKIVNETTPSVLGVILSEKAYWSVYINYSKTKSSQRWMKCRQLLVHFWIAKLSSNNLCLLKTASGFAFSCF